MEKIEEEYNDGEEEPQMDTLKTRQTSLTNLDKIMNKKTSTQNVQTLNSKLKNALLQAISQLLDDIESVNDMISAQA